MVKKIKVKKLAKAEEEIKSLPEEVVLLDDACDVIIKNAFFAIDVLRDIVFCESCHGKRIQ